MRGAVSAVGAAPACFVSIEHTKAVYKHLGWCAVMVPGE